MQTPWGEVEVVDAHVHAFSHAFFRTLAAERGRPDAVDDLIAELGWEAPPQDAAAFADRWVAELDLHGVGRSVLMASVPGDEDSVAAVVRGRPDRFFGYCMFNPLAPDAVGRARRAFDELGMKGLCLFPAMHRFSVQDERLEPLYELAEQRTGVVMFVHMGVLTVGVRKKLGLRSRFDMRFSNPIDLHRVALEHPAIRFVIPHFGAGYFREALMLGDLVPNVYLDTSSSNSWMKYLLPETGLESVFGKVLEVYGVGRLLFGTDSSFFPRGWNRAVFEAQVAVLRGLSVRDDAARAILGGNLIELLGGRTMATGGHPIGGASG